jgi:hypothetical protein
LDKYIKKKIRKSKSSNNIDLPSLCQNSHLYKKKLSDSHGTLLNNKDLLYYELNLRQNNLKSKKNNENIKKNKWNNMIFKEKKNNLDIMNYSNNNSTEKLKNNWLNEKLVNRPYKKIFRKIRYNNKSNIIIREYIKDRNKAYNKLGDNYSLKPYNDKYSEKNYKNIQDMLNASNQTQQTIWFQISLRSSNNNKNIYKKH